MTFTQQPPSIRSFFSKPFIIGALPFLLCSQACSFKSDYASHKNETKPLQEKLNRICWVSYTPTSYNPTTTPVTWPSVDAVKKDLQTLRKAGFNGLITYRSFFNNSTDLPETINLPKLSQDMGFESMILGIWNPEDPDEVEAAIELGQSSDIISLISVGNEGLEKRYSLGTLTQTINDIKEATQLKVTTTEEVTDYYIDSPLFEISDVILLNAFPYYAHVKNPGKAAAWTGKIYQTLTQITDKPVLLKETGYPTAGSAGLSEANQKEYFQRINYAKVPYSVLDAFDVPWKHFYQGEDNVEPHFGVFNHDRTPKLAADIICNKD